MVIDGQNPSFNNQVSTMSRVKSYTRILYLFALVVNYSSSGVARNFSEGNQECRLGQS